MPSSPYSHPIVDLALWRAPIPHQIQFYALLILSRVWQQHHISQPHLRRRPRICTWRSGWFRFICTCDVWYGSMDCDVVAFDRCRVLCEFIYPICLGSNEIEILMCVLFFCNAAPQNRVCKSTSTWICPWTWWRLDSWKAFHRWSLMTAGAPATTAFVHSQIWFF